MIAVLIFLSLGLLALSRLDHPVLRDARWRLSEWLSPLVASVSGPLAPVRSGVLRLEALFQLEQEAARLRQENARLTSAASRAEELERRLVDLSALAKMVPEQPYPVVSARVVAVSAGAFVRTVTISAGRDQGLRSGFPAVHARGVAGRVVDSGRSSARVLLLTDLNSRVPVLVGRGGERAIAAGDNSAEPRLVFLAADAQIRPGEEVVTSGAGGIFPRGLAVGRVSGDGRGGWHVAPHVDLDRIEHLSVLIHPTPLSEIDGNAMTERRP